MTQIRLNYTPRKCFLPSHRLASLKSTKQIHIGSGRRNGKTHHAAALVVTAAISRTCDNAFIAPSLTQAMNIGWRDVLDILGKAPNIVAKRGEALIEVPSADGGTSTIRFFAGTDDGASSGVRGYGFSGVVVLDEVAQIGADVYTDAILPTLAGHPDSLLVTIGTFRGIDLMYQLHEDADPDSGIHSLIIPAYPDGVESGAHNYEELLQIAKQMGGWNMPKFQREFQGNRFQPDERSFFDQTVIRAAQMRDLPHTEMYDLLNSTPLIVGVDVGLKKDRSVIIGRCGHAVIFYDVLENPTAQDLTLKIRQRVEQYQAAACCIDNGSSGAAIADLLRQAGLSPIEIGFGERANAPERYSNRKAEIYDMVRKWTERPNCILPAGEWITRDMSVTRFEVNASNKLVMEPKSSIRKRLKGPSSSTDFLDALACSMGSAVTFAHEELIIPSRPQVNTGDELIERGIDGSHYSSSRRTRLNRNQGYRMMNEEFDPHADY